ncbi:MAG: hypothetical protein FJ086_00230 [Deltaproteobacteria bacterium]|nr:hypothetical protein [Deltaproteobacteria bacterium]
MSGTGPCHVCERPASLPVPGGLFSCAGCAARLGTLLLAGDPGVSRLWPALLEEEEPGPEPLVHLKDGRKVPLRDRTAALKAELDWPARTRLSAVYVEMGLLREAVLEAAGVLGATPDEALSGQALAVLFSPPLAPADPSALRDLLRPH